VDHSIDGLLGPYSIHKTLGTVTIPAKLRQAVGLELGDDISWMLSQEVRGGLLLVPSKQVSRAMPGIIQALDEAGA
jgi:bifunctional DNA-binding transcriptional regulator/antitoxin component of YhaV-PrlF toxin-antitoxin module